LDKPQERANLRENTQKSEDSVSSFLTKYGVDWFQQAQIKTESCDHMNNTKKSKKKKVKCTIVQALRLCTGRTAYRGSKGIALPFHDHCTRRG